MSKNKKSTARHFISTLCHRHHFSNPNTAEIIFTLLFLVAVTRLLALLGSDAKH